MFDLQIAPNPHLQALFASHPRVTSVVVEDQPESVIWKAGDWRRSIFIGHPGCDLRGVVELMDNNPLVCADVFSLPTPAGTLASLAIGPLSEAGLIVER